MTSNRAADYLEQIRQAASDAITFVEGYTKDEFLSDKRTQQAVALSLVIIGEAATRLMDSHPEVIGTMQDVRWREIRGMRSRIAHGYFSIDLAVVWETVQTSLPQLLNAMPGNDGGGDGSGGSMAGGPSGP